MTDEKTLKETLDTLIGDVPVSEQLGAALERMAQVDHVHDEYVTRDEFEQLRKQLEKLIDLVGDAPISEQIYAALNNNK